MIREIDESLITPDKLLSSRDLARLGCGDCVGCSDCCRGRAAAITLDPVDVRLLKEGLNYSFEGLLDQGLIELTLVDGVVLPALSMKASSVPSASSCHPSGSQLPVSDHLNQEDDDEVCVFLNDQGRCSIHAFRPGICRMFPLARLWHEDGSFSYFVQEGECSRGPGAKVRISKWLGYPNIREYEDEVQNYHDALSAFRAQLKTGLSHEEQVGLQRQFLAAWFI